MDEMNHVELVTWLAYFNIVNQEKAAANG